MKAKGMKWLRILHIISVSIWFGGTVCIGALAVICFFNLSETNFLITAPLIPRLYKKIILPIAIFTLLQGLIYGLMTNWGFIKHRWVMLKWIFTFSLIPCIGLGTIGQIFSVIDKVNASGFQGGFSDGRQVLLFISLQILIMLTMIVISVFKPLKKKDAGLRTHIPACTAIR
ncbi:MAG: hypothetical protein GX755_01535 [Syntrophomonadaceae bacterium]|nr:hypothetical protein [Syntrophomonadaceae bacterium]